MESNFFLYAKDRDHEQCYTRPHVAKVNGVNGFAIRNTGILKRKDLIQLRKAIERALDDDKREGR